MSATPKTPKTPKIPTVIKTLEFKIYLKRSQQETIDEWLAVLKYVWNQGVELIKRFNQFNYYDKRFKALAPCCPIVTYEPRGKDSYASCPTGTCKPKERSVCNSCRALFPSCPIGWQLDNYSGLHHFWHGGIEKWELQQELVDEGQLREGFVTSYAPTGIFPVQRYRGGKLVTNLTFFELLGIFAHKRFQDKPWVVAVDSKFLAGIVKTLAESWEAFVHTNRKPPKFKKKNERVNTLIHRNTKPDKKTGKAPIIIQGDRIKLPKAIGWVRVKGLSKRWPQGMPFCPLKICRKASGYYLQLSGEFPVEPVKLKPKIKAVGLDPGVESVYTDDVGKHVKVPPYLERGLKKLKDLQRKAQRQWDNNHGKRTSQLAGWHPPMADVPWEQKNWKRTQKKIARLHEKIARRGRAANHLRSTRIKRQFQEIYLEDYKVSEVVGKVAPIDSGRMTVNKNNELTTIYEKNGRSRNRDMNRAALRNRVGQLWEMIESKCGDRVIRIERAGTSSECPKCGHSEEKPLKLRVHHCKQCGYKTHRDTAAAQVIKKRGQEIREAEAALGKKKQKHRRKIGDREDD